MLSYRLIQAHHMLKAVVSCSPNFVAVSWKFLGFLAVLVVDITLFLVYERTFCPAKFNLDGHWQFLMEIVW
jgi:hypothetical protein